MAHQEKPQWKADLEAFADEAEARARENAPRGSAGEVYKSESDDKRPTEAKEMRDALKAKEELLESLERFKGAIEGIGSDALDGRFTVEEMKAYTEWLRVIQDSFPEKS